MKNKVIKTPCGPVKGVALERPGQAVRAHLLAPLIVGALLLSCSLSGEVISDFTAAHEPCQKPGRSLVVWIGRWAGLSSCNVSGMRPFAMAGCNFSP